MTEKICRMLPFTEKFIKQLWIHENGRSLRINSPKDTRKDRVTENCLIILLDLCKLRHDNRNVNCDSKFLMFKYASALSTEHHCNYQH